MDVGSRNDATSESSAPSPLALVSPMSPMESQQPSEQLVTLTVVWHAEMSVGPSASCSTIVWKSRVQQPPVADMVATLASHLTMEECYNFCSCYCCIVPPMAMDSI